LSIILTNDQKIKNNQLIKLNKIKVIIQGFGVIGASTAVNIVSSNNFDNNFQVHCIDKKNLAGIKKIYDAKKGIFPIKSSDKLLSTYLRKALYKKRISFGFDEKEYKNADIIIVSINCDLENKNAIKIREFRQSIISILENISENTLLIIESTVPPGTCERIIYPDLKKITKQRKINIEKIYLAHSFERVTPGENYLISCRNSYRVYAGINKISEEKCKKFLKKIINVKQYPLTKLMNITSSETCKLMENSYRAVNIAFIDEWVKFSNNLNINLFDIIDSIKKRKTHNNIMLPGLGVGGYCLTKDPLFAKISTKQILKQKKQSFPLCSSAVAINQKMPNTSMDFIEQNYKKKLKEKKVLFLGVSYKNEISDLRFSPSLDLIKKFINKKSKCFYFDPFVERVNIKGLTRVQLLSQLNNFDLIVFCVNHLKFKKIKFTKKLSNGKNYLFDLNNVLTLNQINKIKKQNINFYSLGRDKN